MIMFVTDFNPQFQFLITMLVTVLVEFTSSLHALRSKRPSQATASNSGSYKVNFVLPDELPSNHFIGNIPDQLPTFPLNSGSDFSVSTTVIDAAGLAPRLVHASDSGDLYTSTSLDRDNPDQLCGPLNCCKLLVCNLTFTVLFVHPRWKTLSVQVNLQFHDTNDNEPRFPQETFSIWIPENNALEKAPAERNPDIIGTMYGIPHAHDYDSEPNGVIAYALIGSTVTKRTFALYSNETTGQLAVIVQPGARIDHENLAERIFKLTVEARDGGSPPRRGEMLIMIHITDLNDNVPVFESPKHSIQLAEHTMYSEPIYVVHASDLDSDDNGMIRYMFGSSYPTMPDSVRRRFSLHPVTGELYLRQTLDYESYEERRIELTFIAYDAGNPPLSATMTLAIVVQDINDNPPELVVQANHTIVENTEPNQLALRLLLRDLDEVSSNSVSCEPDSNLQVPLRYEKSPDGTIFSIYTKSSIDFEETPRLYYGITCTDFVEPRQIRRFNMTVLVKDVNDNSPIFHLDNSGQMRLYNPTMPIAVSMVELFTA
ncbi:unnamed protein product [Dicrocoelium dendriticum]|nr:unnamed protein product [Dicrocoelium dendriticum]